MSTPRISDFKLPFEWDVVDQHTGEHQGRAQDYRPVTVADLVAALIAEGGEIAYVYGDGSIQRSHFETPPKPGRYLVFPIPVESAEAKET